MFKFQTTQTIEKSSPSVIAIYLHGTGILFLKEVHLEKGMFSEKYQKERFQYQQERKITDA